jgi:transcriptional regulator with XRE-family HTH domain
LAQKSIKVIAELAKTIKFRRNELNLTIEEAASKAGVGTKTWSRYEAGESIRKDKSRGICKALNWPTLPEHEKSGDGDTLDISDYINHDAWSPYLMDTFGKYAAISFAIGSDILLDHLRDDVDALSSMPRGSHIGEIGNSWLASDLPPQFLMRYDYEFLYVLRKTIERFRAQASAGSQIIAHSVLEELALYLIVEESRFLMESVELDAENDDIEAYEDWDEWIYAIFDDADLLTFLYSNWYLTKSDVYHYDRWLEEQFYCP